MGLIDARLDEIEELILLADLSVIPSDDEEVHAQRLQKTRSQLAIQLGCTLQDIEDIIESKGADWNTIVLSQRVKRGLMNSSAKDTSWDKLEYAVLNKLNKLVEGGAIHSVSELVAIAKVANAANRSTTPNRQPNGGVSQTNVFFGQQAGDVEAVLPAGDLGVIRLSLGSRIQQQLTQTIDHDVGERKRTIDNVEMLDVDGIRDAVKDMD